MESPIKGHNNTLENESESEESADDAKELNPLQKRKPLMKKKRAKVE